VTDRDQVIEREERRALPTALATMAGVVVVIISAIVLGSVNGDGDAELLRSAKEHSSAVTISSLLQSAGFLLLLPGLLYLFRAALARSDTMRAQFVGVVVAAPIFLAGFAICNGVATNDAAKDFVAGGGEADITRSEAAKDCRSDNQDLSQQACIKKTIADDRAQDAVSHSSLRAAAVGLGLGGRLGLAAALLYTALYAMRTGLMTRFWGSLGMALGVISFLILQFTLVWFIYVALLIAGWVPGGRPPAWAAGEAIPWPTPGEGGPPDDDGTVAGSGRPLSDEEDEAGAEAPAAPSPRERRKRKQRRT